MPIFLLLCSTFIVSLIKSRGSRCHLKRSLIVFLITALSAIHTRFFPVLRVQISPEITKTSQLQS